MSELRASTRRGLVRPQPRDTRIAIRSNRALELRAQGKTYREIQEMIRREFDLPRYSYRLALDDCNRALNQICIENTQSVHALRGLELKRYDDYLDKIYDQIENGDLDAVQTALKISKERSKILGLYAPVEVKIQQIAESRVREELGIFFEFLNNSEYIPEYVLDQLYEVAEQIQNRVAVSDFATEYATQYN
jgi:DNA mismatch repair ATPase MutS